MKKPLLFVASLLVWLIGPFLLTVIGNIYTGFAHPDGISYGSSILRDILFGMPDLIFLFSGYFLFGGVILLSPYRKITGIILILSGLYFGIKGVLSPEEISSMYVHVLINVWSVIMGLAGIFGKSYDETNPPPPEPTPPQPLSDEARRKAMRELMSLRDEASKKQ